MKWHDFITNAIASLICLVIWKLSLRSLYRHIPNISGEETYFPKRLIHDDNALNRFRLNISESIYKKLIKESDHFSPLEIRIIASNRRQNYLIQVIAFLVSAYQSNNRFSPNLELCNVESEIFDELKKFQLHIPIRMLGMRNSPHNLSLNETIMKEALDYWNCLNRTTKARYVLLLEDDALVVPKFASMMTSVMKQMDQRQEIDYLKMYHPSHLRKIPSLPMTIIISLTICYIYQMIIHRRVSIFWFVVTSVLIYYELSSYGFQFLADLRYYITNTVYMSVTESCCTPAVLFRARKIPQIVDRLSIETIKSASDGRAKDHILDESSFIGRQTDTNLVVHIGSMSSIRHRRIKLDEVLFVENRQNN
ncbi:hypothetical protein KIN20_000799 [Parelaphostrongylus tenuis]|uniref:Glycosyltransferase n=1 Tax=Parelaphostrongylus tenuis TaxID=148309 RepID=A0AAD5QC40_PARTN|nr:hypothetical protein KIN20_000799 [Parelaphostrongylus tenuis]